MEFKYQCRVYIVDRNSTVIVIAFQPKWKSWFYSRRLFGRNWLESWFIYVHIFEALSSARRNVFGIIYIWIIINHLKISVRRHLTEFLHAERIMRECIPHINKSSAETKILSECGERTWKMCSHWDESKIEVENWKSVRTSFICILDKNWKVSTWKKVWLIFKCSVFFSLWMGKWMQFKLSSWEWGLIIDFKSLH